MVALLAVLGLQALPARGQIAPANHLDGPQVHYLFGSGSQTGGKLITLRVELTGPAPVGGAAVVLTSDEPSVIPLPPTVTVPAGQTEHTFTANTNPVSADIHVRVSAGYGRVTKGREVLIRDPDLRALHLQSIIRGGGQGKLTACLTGAAPAGGTTVNLSTGFQPTGIVGSPLNVPATITIPAGSGCLSIAVDADEVPGDVPVTVMASYRGVTLSANAIVRDFAGPPPPTATATETATEVPTATASNTPEPTATNTEVPTATATNTEVPTATATATEVALSAGCTAMNNPSFDAYYGITFTGATTFAAGETLTITAAAPAGAGVTLITLHSDSEVTLGSSPFPGTITYTFPADSNEGIHWFENTEFAGATWTVSCTAGTPV